VTSGGFSGDNVSLVLRRCDLDSKADGTAIDWLTGKLLRGAGAPGAKGAGPFYRCRPFCVGRILIPCEFRPSFLLQRLLLSALKSLCFRNYRSSDSLLQTTFQ
jgi:hypothetical protein